MFGGGNPFSPHSDILSATASSLDDAYKLVDECKNRGRNTVASKRYPEAQELYSKAIAVLSSFLDDTNPKLSLELAVLYSNRSLVRLQMNDVSTAFQDATTATSYDDTYVKGHWRLGQAAMALKDMDTAISAFTKALQLEPENKALLAEIQKARQQQLLQQQQEQQQKNQQQTLQDEDNTAVKTGDTIQKTCNTVPTTLQKNGGDNKTASVDSQSHKESTTQPEGEQDLFSHSDHVRGYKLVNGKKTSFFHHEQTEQEKQLIGDIAPKRISTTTTSTNVQPVSTTTSSSTSAWNKAGTWEERDLTPVAIATLSDTLLQCSFAIPTGAAFAGSVVRVTQLSKLESVKDGGTTHASIATVRGKKRFIFEFSVTVFWELVLVPEESSSTSNNSVCKGTMTFPDVDGTHELGQGYDLSDYTVDKDTPSHARFLLERFVRDGGLRTVLEQAMDQWIVHLRDNN